MKYDLRGVVSKCLHLVCYYIIIIYYINMIILLCQCINADVPDIQFSAGHIHRIIVEVLHALRIMI